MPNTHKNNYLQFILLFVAIRVILNVFALSHYGFQRDELLHLAVGDHLAWGYKEVPPFIALIAKLSTRLFGSSVAAARVFTTLCSGLIVLFTGLLTVEFGGRRFAIALSCLTLIFSPAFLGSGYLLQPVVFDQLWWLMAAYYLVRYFNSQNVKYIYFLGIVIGVGMLTKYTMAFFTLALILGIVLTHQRKIFTIKALWFAVAIAIIIFLPNIVWQLTHHFPLATHMRKLRNNQLDYVQPSDFLVQQILVNGVGLFVWVTGFFSLLFVQRLRAYRFVALAYLFTLLLFVVLKGKSYYLFGAYPMLFAAGGSAFEKVIKPYFWRTVTTLVLILPSFILLPMVLPVVPIKSALPLFAFIRDKIGVDFPFKWEDQQMHATTQDYADMFGWDQMGLKVAQAYYRLTSEQRKQTIIYANNYGDAGAIHHYGKQYHLPDVVCLNSSFALWAPDTIKAKYWIYVDDYDGNKNIFKLTRLKLIGAYKKMGEIVDPLAREQGDCVYILSDLKPGLQELYHKELMQTKIE